MPTLKIGDKAPLFEGTTTKTTGEGKKFALSDVLGKNAVVLYFYPKDMTPGCTAEACAFRDNWEKIVSLGATIVGVSSQSVESHAEFKGKYSLPFTLVSDPGKEIRKLYGVNGFLIPPRVTFIIDREGVIRSIIDSQLNITRHIEGALASLSASKSAENTSKEA